ncbi:MAG: HEAT repeat domain-containing protein [Burkholderiales bacterium]|nr:HEAT repeat domain-containing protein [Anaerolineae bacterium]
MSEFRPNIWLLQARADTEGLVKALQDSDPDIRRRAAVALRALGAAASIRALRAALEEEADAQVRADMFNALEHLLQDSEPEPEAPKPAPEPSQLMRLIGQIKSDDEQLVIRAVKILAEMKDRRAVEPLVVLFHNRQLSTAVRLAAAEALLKLESAPTVVTLLAALRSKNWQTRRNAAGVLGQLRADWAAQPLITTLRDEHPMVRRTARAALKYIGTPEARQALRFAAAYDKNETSETAAAAPTTPDSAAAALETLATTDSGDSSADAEPVDAAPARPPTAPLTPPTTSAETSAKKTTDTQTAVRIIVADRSTGRLARTAPLTLPQSMPTTSEFTSVEETSPTEPPATPTNTANAAPADATPSTTPKPPSGLLRRISSESNSSANNNDDSDDETASVSPTNPNGEPPKDPPQ